MQQKMIRCHLIRCVRYSLLLIGAVFMLTVVWRFLGFSEDAVMRQHIGLDVDHLMNDNVGVHNKLKVGLSYSNFENSKLSQQAKIKSIEKSVQVDEAAQFLLDYIANYLRINYDVVANEGGRFHVNITLTNTGSKPIDRCCFSIFFAHMKYIDLFTFNAGMYIPLSGENPPLTNKLATNFALSHVNGYTFNLRPTSSFEGLKHGESEVLRIVGAGWSVSRGEVLPNWYVAGDAKTTLPRLIKSTVGEGLEFVGDFDTVKKSVRGDEDLYRPFTPKHRYARNKVVSVSDKTVNSVLPTPLSVRKQHGDSLVYINGNSWKIVYNRGLQNEAQYLKNALQVTSIFQSNENDCLEQSILLRLSDDPIQLPDDVDSAKYIMDEAYTLTVSADANCVTIVGQKQAGVFYGAVSFISLAHGSSLEKGASAYGYRVPAVLLVDAPRYEYRGIMIDVARNFHSVADILKLIDCMALYKLNKLHLHLSDDEGWRLEIPALPELIEVGSRRGHSVKEDDRLMSMLGSGPFSNTSGSGYFSVDEYRKILTYAVSRHVEVIPEFDMPSHSHAALKSMKRRYKRLRKEHGNDTEIKSDQYILSDIEDESIYMTGQFFRDSAVNPCVESTFRFVDAIMHALVIMHRDIQPLRRWHFGGDEVPQDAYTASPACYKFMQSHSRLKSTKDLKTYFVRRVVAIAARHNLSIFGWEDAFSSVSGEPIPRRDLKTSLDVVSQAYYNTWESGAASKAYQYANSGYKVVLSPITAAYFDNPQEPDPEDWGLHWATRYVDTRRTFSLIPDSLYDSIDEEFWGAATSKQLLCDTNRIPCTSLEYPENILGIEGVLWSELVRTPSRMDWMLWPRMLALAERSWHRASWEQPIAEHSGSSINRTAMAEDWTRFAIKVGYKEMRRLEAQGVDYYLPRPGARVHNGKLSVNTAFPGLVVQFSVDDGKTWSDFVKSVPYSGQLLLATRSHDRKRRGVPVKIFIP